MADLYLVDDHTLMRDAMRSVLEKNGHRVVGETGEPGAAMADLERLRPEVVLLDLRLDHRSGLEVLEHVRRRGLPSQVIVLTMSNNPMDVAEALRLGAQGYVLKESASVELLDAIAAVASGKRYLCKRASALAVEGLMSRSSSSAVNALSAREKEVILRVVRGETSAAIAARLDISPKTVESYRGRIMAKLGVNDIPALVRLAVREGLIGLDD